MLGSVNTHTQCSESENLIGSKCISYTAFIHSSSVSTFILIGDTVEPGTDPGNAEAGIHTGSGNLQLPIQLLACFWRKLKKIHTDMRTTFTKEVI